MCLVLYLVLIIFETEAIEFAKFENPVIRLRVNDTNKSYTVLKGKPLKIVIENVYPRHVWCNNYYKNTSPGKTSGKFVDETEFNTDLAVLIVTNVTDEMSTRWRCTAREYNDGSGVDLFFHLHVKGARSVNLTVNDRVLPYVTANLSVNYDGDATYDYEDGEEVDFTCTNTKNYDVDPYKSETQLKYYSAQGTLLLETKFSTTQKIKFRSVLKPEHDKHYLVCVRNTFNPERSYKYRTTFYIKKSNLDAVQHAMILSVNGQKLTTSGVNQTSDDADWYLFRYIEGEVLNVTCQINHNVKGGTIVFHSDAKKDVLGQALKDPEKKLISVRLRTSNLNNKTVTCGINNTNIQKPNAIILFQSDVRNNEGRVRGLNRRNILFQYSSELYQWNIGYQYSVNDTLNLTCVWKNGFQGDLRKSSLTEKPYFLWKFQGKDIESTALETTIPYRLSFSEKTFTTTLDASHDKEIIQCVYEHKKKYLKYSVKIILRLKPVLEVESDGVTADAKDSAVPRIVSLVFAGIAIVIVTIVCVAFYRKRRKQSRLNQNAYDNLSNQNDSPIPAFPHQWDIDNDDSHYSRIDEGVMQENYNYATVNDKLNRMPLNRQSNTSENHYSEIDEYSKPKSEGLTTNWNNTVYAQPSNSKGNGSHTNKAIYNNIGDSNQGTYDKLRHDKPCNKNLNSSNANYSNVQRKGSKNKSVRFGPNCKQDCNTDRRFKQNNSGYENAQPVYMQPENVKKQASYENHHVQNKSTDNTDSDYAEPYSELEVSCKNDLYVSTNY